MADIIDSFVVSLGLDARQYNDEIKKFRKGVKDDRDAARSDAREESVRRQRSADGVRSLRNEVVGLTLAFAGANSIKDFAFNVLNADANTGRLANNLGIATDKLSAWQMAVKTVGGDTKDADGAFQALNNIYENFVLRGDASKGYDLAALGLSYNDLKDLPTAMLKLAGASEHMSKQKYNNLLAGLGINQNMVNLLEKGRQGTADLVEEQRKHGVITERDAAEAQKFQKALADLENEITGQARPAITGIAEGMADFFKSVGAARIAGPLLIGTIVAIGTAAVVALGPVGLLAGAIAGLFALFSQPGMLKRTEDAFSVLGLKAEAQYHHFRSWLAQKSGNAPLAIREKKAEVDALSRISGIYAEHDTASPASGGAVKDQFTVLEQAYGKDRARGIWAGIGAESGWNPNSVNPESGAYGLGQWLGPRLKRLRQRYGKNPTAAQQIEFLMWEINGGDAGGASVRGGSSVSDTTMRYLRDFMRPGKGLAGDLRRAGVNPGINVSSAGPSSTSNSVGQIVIYTAATDAKGIAREIGPEIAKRGIVVRANTGLQQ